MISRVCWSRLASIRECCRCAVLLRSLSNSQHNYCDLKTVPNSMELKQSNSRRKLAEIMGADPDNFSDSDVQNSLEYLFPTSLTEKSARPGLTHPLIRKEYKDLSFDEQDRPFNAGFFTGSPAYHDLKFNLYNILSSESLNSLSETQNGITWVKKSVLEDLLAETMTDKQYELLLSLFRKTSCYHLSEASRKFLEKYRVSTDLHVENSNRESFMESWVSGQRKTSSAIVKVFPGTGKIHINSKKLLEYFPRLEDRQQVLFPFHVTDSLGKYDVQIHVKGGGMTGQAGAVRLGISKALALHPEIVVNHFFNTLLVSDTRNVERKKPGQKKARKKFAWVRR